GRVRAVVRWASSAAPVAGSRLTTWTSACRWRLASLSARLTTNAGSSGMYRAGRRVSLADASWASASACCCACHHHQPPTPAAASSTVADRIHSQVRRGRRLLAGAAGFSVAVAAAAGTGRAPGVDAHGMQSACRDPAGVLTQAGTGLRRWIDGGRRTRERARTAGAERSRSCRWPGQAPSPAKRGRVGVGAAGGAVFRALRAPPSQPSPQAGEGARTAAWKGAGSLCVRVDQPAHADRGRGGRMGGGFGLAAAAAALAAPGAGGVAVAAGLTGADVGLAQLQAVLAQQLAQPRQA